VTVLIDCGEFPDENEDLWSLADVLCCACGGHAGDETTMARVADFCRRSGRTRLGAHPSYEDRDGFGRSSPVDLPGFDLAGVTASLTSQCRTLRRIAEAAGVAVTTLKPHGALYHDAATRADIAGALIEAGIDALGPAVTIVGPPSGALRDEASRRGVEYWREGFADRRMRGDGSLVPRSEPGAMITDPVEAARQAAALAGAVDVVCVHGDTAGSKEILRAVRTVFDRPPLERRWQWLGDRAIRFSRPPGSKAASLVESIRRWPGVVDVVVAPGDVGVYFEGEPSVDEAAIEALWGPDAGEASGRMIEIPAIYDGTDLADVARAAGLSIEDVIEIHASGTYRVDALGFAPGFAYLTGLDPRLHVARRATPRTRVPAGAIAVAGGYTGVYPFDSPGGWHLIGRVVDVHMFSVAGSLLQLGDQVRFVR
jgi:UPF0271 protein